MGGLYRGRSPACRAANDVQPDWRECLQNTKKPDVSAKALQATGERFADRTDLAYGIICNNRPQHASFAEGSYSLFFGNILIGRILPTAVTRTIELSARGGSAGPIGSSTASAKGGNTVIEVVNGKFGSVGRFNSLRGGWLSV